ncbi:MAG TPA: 50S ribosomal protein L11 methyltransferase [Gammaproteobacteria bacterium]|nr:50S ribosomal protein L11 methyltransferase [Gammaproteobacteria bacterium]
MSWLELKLALGKLDPEKVEDALLEAGAVSVTLEDAGDEPLYEPDPLKPPLWSDTRLTALFAADADMDGVKAFLLAALKLPALPAHQVRPLADRDWTREWLKDFKPMRFGRRLWVCPTGYTPPDPAAVNLSLDPGLAFGTGTHATTALCLEWLDGATLAGGDVIDYGCGSGILAIAAARLGARRVRAVDTDPQALVATRDNAARNGVEGLIEVSAPEALGAGAADALLANILAGPLMQLAPRLAGLIKPGGDLVLSGILESQEADIRAAYETQFEAFEVAKREDWLRIKAVRKAH